MACAEATPVVPRALFTKTPFIWFWIRCFADVHTCRLVGRQVGRLVGRQVGKLVVRQVGKLVGRWRRVGKLVGRQVGSLVGWLCMPGSEGAGPKGHQARSAQRHGIRTAGGSLRRPCKDDHTLSVCHPCQVGTVTPPQKVWGKQ